MTTWAWRANDAVDVEVKRGFERSQKIFSRHSSPLRQGGIKSSICKTCELACVNAHLSNGPGAIWSKNKKEFETSTRSDGCHLCILIAHAFDQKNVAAFREMSLEQDITLNFSFAISYRDPSSKLNFEQRTHLSIEIEDNEPDEFWLKVESESRAPIGDVKIQLRLQPFAKGHHSNDVIATKPGRHKSTGNEQNLNLALVWIKTCEEAHPMCRRFRPLKPDWRPSRLIDVGVAGVSEPKLSISEDNSGAVAYCALSHCWGTDRSIILTTDTLSTYQTQLPVEKVPATISNAIETTRRLGYSFLWADSLCIIQDSKADWEIESPQMSDVYGLSACTIAAAAAQQVTQDMYQNRDPRKIRPCVIKVKMEKGSAESWVAYPQSPEQMVISAFDENPLSRRGWALQERILSPRILMFGKNQMLWSCATLEACETFPIGLDPQFSTPLSELRSLAVIRQRFMRLFHLHTPPSDVWEDIVTIYTKADLTVTTDKLVALQGIVSRINENFNTTPNIPNGDTEDNQGSEYLAGIWKDKNFARNLLWRTVPGASRGRPQEYRAPSWSWASIDGEVVQCEEFVQWNADEQLVRVCDASVDNVRPSGGGAFNRPGEGRLPGTKVLCATMFPLAIRKPWQLKRR